MKKICVLAFINMLLLSCLQSHSASAAESAALAAAQIIQTEEVKDDAAADEQKVSLSDVEKSRALTGDRLYGLAGFWLLIALAIFLIRCQLKDDEKLYQEGYYRKDIEEP